MLVVADPAADLPLIGAREEGQLVVELCKRFNGMYRDNQIEVKRLIGPYDAQRMNVLEELLLETYDVLHFCGHCHFDKDTPSKSGFIFGKDNGKEIVLSARELLQIDRVPRFIFANACESGVTPERPEVANPAFAPSFAEAFFARGVANFICTGWPVNDAVALEFAEEFYSTMFGLTAAEGPAPIHRALQRARIVAGGMSDARSWGAYQHYGNPFFRFFDGNSARRK